DTRNHFPGIAAIATAEQGGRFDAAEEFVAFLARFKGPDVGEGASVVFGKSRRGFCFLEILPEVGRAENLHAEEGIAARGVETGRAPGVDERGIDGDAWAEGAAQGEAAAGLRGFGDKEALFSANAKDESICHSCLAPGDGGHDGDLIAG